MTDLARKPSYVRHQSPPHDPGAWWVVARHLAVCAVVVVAAIVAGWSGR